MTARGGHAVAGVAALAAFAADCGDPIRAAANTPMLLHDAQSVWFVAEGALDVFCAERHEGRAAAAAKHLLRASAGRLVFGLPDLDGPLTVVAKGLAGTRLLRLDAAELGTPAAGGPGGTGPAGGGGAADGLEAEVARQARAWVSDIAGAVAADIEYRPRTTALITLDAAGARSVSPSSGTASAGQGGAPPSGAGRDRASPSSGAASAGQGAGAAAESLLVPVEDGSAGGDSRDRESLLAPVGDSIAAGDDTAVAGSSAGGDGAVRASVFSVEEGSVLGTRGSEVVWISASPDADAAALWYLGTEVLPQPAAGAARWMPLTPGCWVTVSGSGARGSPRSETELRVLAAPRIGSGELLGALADFHAMAFSAETLNRRLLLADEANAQTALATHRRLERERAEKLLGSLAGTPREATVPHSTALLDALRRIGRHSGIEFREPRLPLTAPPPSLEQVIEASGLRARRVRLAPEDQWWRTDSGAMLAYRRDSTEPVALLPALTGYRAVGADGRSARVGATAAGDYSSEAWTVYPKLADDRAATARDLIRLARCGMGADLTRFAVAGLVAALITQSPAIALGMLSEWALPFARGGALAQILVALAVLTVAATVLAVSGSMALLRLEARAGARLSAAAWDRLLALPPPFFRDTVAGELAVRMGTFQRLRDLLSGVVARVLASVVFLLPTLGLLLFYDAVLAAVAVLMTAVALAVTVGLGLAQIPHQRYWHTAVRTLWGRLFQFIGGITKIRASGAETAAFASWADAYRDKQVAEIRSSRIDEHLAAFGAAYPFVFAAVLCAVTVGRGDAVTVGDFVVALTASFILYAAVADLGRAVDAMAEAYTAYEQITPVLEAVPERDAAVSAAPTVLDGELVIDQASFRYRPDGPPVLDEVSLTARPGEFVAVVGGSGAGKSTLVRLMLGLEAPERGAVFFDGRDLRNLDRRAVRRQIGVVPQDSSLQPGSIAENIIGMAEDLTLDDAWKAARLAAVDRDIAEMPMQMMTMVADRAGIFSGGQIQRIRIASALAREPRIVILDEATSWLDSRSQAEVMNSIEGLGVTRIVIAHRLSTIRRADRIYVLDAGRLVQVGGYEELLEAPGPFRELVSRQLL